MYVFFQVKTTHKFLSSPGQVDKRYASGVRLDNQKVLGQIYF